MGHGPIHNQVSTEWCYGSINNQVSTEWGHGPINNQNGVSIKNRMVLWVSTESWSH